jgi:hypothetical protein
MPGNAKKKCPKAGNLYVEVRRQNKDSPKKWDKLSQNCAMKLGGGHVDSRAASTKDNTTYKNLCAGGYTLMVKPTAEEAGFDITEKIEQKGKVLQDEKNVGTGHAQSGVTIEDQKTRMHYYRFYPFILRVVVEDDQGKKLEGVTIKATGGPEALAPKTTDKKGLADFGYVKKAEYTLEASPPPQVKGAHKVFLPAPKGEGREGKVDHQEPGKDPYKVVIAPVARIYLKLVFQDPENNERNFPKDFELKMNFEGELPDKTKVKVVKVGDNGIVGSDGNACVEVPRSVKSFTLDFQQKEASFIVCEKRGEAAKTQDLKKEGDLNRDDLTTYRAFKLPAKEWTLRNSEWEVSGTSAYSRDEKKFSNLESPQTSVGAAGGPVKLLLKPHWQYTRFVYYDRWLKPDKRISIPPIFVQGFLDKAAVAGATDTESNWTINADDKEVRQCLPWIIQEPKKAKPDDKVLLKFETKDDSFIETAADKSARKIVSGTKHDTPSADRLRFYDLPKLWKSQVYYCRLGAGGTVDKENRFEKLAAKPTSAAEPLIFCLDDIVLTDDKLKPIAWTPAEPASIFSHFFNDKKPDNSAVANVSPEGIYKPDSANKKSFFTKKPDDDANKPGEKDRNYIADYPDWTRLVAAQGNLFDVFHQRTIESTPPAPTEVVGARAGVRWVDATAAFSGIGTWDFAPTPPAIAADSKPKPRRLLYDSASPYTPKRPSRTNKPFFVIHPFFEHRFAERYNAPYNKAQDEGGGRFDMALVRCCDAVPNAGDATKLDEVAINLHFFRFAFKFTADPASDAGMVTTPGGPYPHKSKAEYQELIIKNVNARWNGNDAVNSFRARLVPSDANQRLQIQVLWFAQALPFDLAHIEVNVLPTTHDGRDNRGSYDGTGESQTKSYQEWGDFHTSAHECGHADTLPDEYNERWDGASCGRLSLKCNTPADPYEPDGRLMDGASGADKPMMNTVHTMRNRYFWHSAEWARVVCNNIKFKVHYKAGAGAEYPDYQVPPHENDDRTYAFWPIEAQLDHNLPAVAPFSSNRGKVDLFLYTLGKEKFSRDVLPSLENPPGATLYDGVLYLLIKLKCTLGPTPIPVLTTHADHLKAQQLLDALANAAKKFNHRFYATGVARDGTDQKWTFTRALLYVSPRFVVANFANNALVADIDTKLKPHFEINVQPAAAASAEWVVNPVSPDLVSAANWQSSTTTAGKPRNDARILSLDTMITAYHAIDGADLVARVNKLNEIIAKADEYVADPAGGTIAPVHAMKARSNDRKRYYERCAASDKLKINYRAASMLDDVRNLFVKYLPGLLGIYKLPNDIGEADLKPFLTPLNLTNSPDVHKTP